MQDDETTEEAVKTEVADTPDNTPKEAAHKDSKNSHGNQKRPIIVIKRVKKVIHPHHGGSWKIAYADFVTAMMTFFLLMWLLSMLNKHQLQGISEYFKRPIKNDVTQELDPKMDKVKTDNTLKTKDLMQPKKSPSETKTKVEMEKTQNAASLKMKKELEEKINKDPKMSQYKNSLNIEVVANGLKIEMRELEGKPMFSNGKTDFGEHAKNIIDWLAPEVNQYPNRVMIIGHTDSKPLVRDNYTNWELSADRSNATRRELINHGMDPSKIVRVVGMSDTDKLDNTKGDDPSNRRIVIIILNDDAYKKILQE